MDFQQTMNLATENLRAGRLVEAETLLRSALAEKPRHADGLHLLGCTLSRMGQPAEAVDLIHRAIAIEPGQSVFHNNLGLSLLVLGKKADAIAAFRKAIALSPGAADSHNHLGNTLADIGEFEEAISCFNHALAIKPGHAPYHYNLGNCWLRMPVGANRTEDLLRAVSCFERAIALSPDFANAANNLGNALQQLGRMDEAIGAWERASTTKPHAMALYNLGRAFYEKDRVDDALKAIQECLRAQPDHADSLNNLGNVLRQSAQFDEAIASFDRAIALDEGCAKAQSNRLYTLYYHPDYDAGRILGAHRRWDERIARPLRLAGAFGNDRSSGRQLRIGYVSPNFSEHCQSLFTVPLFSRHDHSKFEIYCYSDVKSPDAMTEKLFGWADVWRNIVGMSDDEAAALIRRDKIDILVDLTLHMAENRILLFARKPAPVQVTWLGYPGTTGLEAMDYRLTDPYLDPAGDGHGMYSEKSVRLPHTFWCIDPVRGMSEDLPGVNELPALECGHITFGCLNNFCKINEPLLRLWGRVLDTVPGSRLIMLAPLGERRNWVSEILGGRVEFISRQNRREYLAIYHRIDLGLDTLPYNGHTTSLDSFWMGVPVVTLVGKTIVGRAGLSQLSNLGLSELAAATPEQFVKLAAGLAKDLERLRELRRTLRERMLASPLMDGERFAGDIESAYRLMWRSWCE